MKQIRKEEERQSKKEQYIYILLFETLGYAQFLIFFFLVYCLIRNKNEGREISAN